LRVPAFAVYAVAAPAVGERDAEALGVLGLDSNLMPSDDGVRLWITPKLCLDDRDGVASLAKIA
jgi:hypothetical protein